MAPQCSPLLCIEFSLRDNPCCPLQPGWGRWGEEQWLDPCGGRQRLTQNVWTGARTRTRPDVSALTDLTRPAALRGRATAPPTASDGPNTPRGRGRAGCWQRGQRIRTRTLRGRYNGYSEHLGAEQLRAWKEEEESRSDGSAKQIVWRREEEEEQGEHLLFQCSSGVLPSTKLYDRNLSSLGICGNFLRTSESQKTSLIITKINFVLLLFSVDVGAILILGFLIFSILWIRELSLVTINILQDKLGFLCYIFILRF